MKDSRKWLRTAAVALGVLLVFAVGAGIYSFWPRSLDDVRSMAKQRTSLRRPSRKKSNPTLSVCGSWFTTGPLSLWEQSWSTNRRPFSTSCGPISQRCATASASARNAPHCPASTTSHVRRNCPAGNQSGQQPPDSPVLYLDKADYRIHGFDGSARISLPEGCIRLIKDDVIYLYNHTPLETRCRRSELTHALGLVSGAAIPQ